MCYTLSHPLSQDQFRYCSLICIFEATVSHYLSKPNFCIFLVSLINTNIIISLIVYILTYYLSNVALCYALQYCPFLTFFIFLEITYITSTVFCLIAVDIQLTFLPCGNQGYEITFELSNHLTDFHKTWYEHYVPVFLFRMFKALNTHNNKTCSKISASTCGSELYKAKNIRNMGSRQY